MVLVYKACQNSIVTLELLPDSLTNEKREGVYDKKFAKFRCDKAKVVLIENVETGEEMFQDISISDKSFIYKKGEIVSADYFDNEKYLVCGHGIHYFKTPYPALAWYYHNKQKWDDGYHKTYYHDGHILYEKFIKNGERDGKYIDYWINGNKKLEENYENGLRKGKSIIYEPNGEKRRELHYGKGEIVGLSTIRLPN